MTALWTLDVDEHHAGARRRALGKVQEYGVAGGTGGAGEPVTLFVRG